MAWCGTGHGAQQRELRTLKLCAWRQKAPAGGERERVCVCGAGRVSISIMRRGELGDIGVIEASIESQERKRVPIYREKRERRAVAVNFNKTF